MTVLQAAIFRQDPPTGAQLRRAAATLGYPIDFERNGNLDAALNGSSGRIDADLAGVRTGFAFSVESGENADRMLDAPLFAEHGSTVWTTTHEGDDRQFLATLYLLRAALTAQPGTYWDGAEFHQTPAALEKLDAAIDAARVLLNNPHRLAGPQRKRASFKLRQLSIGTVIRLVILLLLVLKLLHRLLT